MGIPIIDLSGLSGDIEARRAVGLAINAACEDTGFLCVTNHGVPQALIDRVRTASLAFFDKPLEEKMALLRQPPSYRGYIPLASEALARSTGKADAQVDLKEAFSMGPVDVPDDAYHTAPEAAPHFAPNRWPDAPADFRPALEEYYATLAELAGRLLGGFALALDVEEDWFADKVDRHISNLRALHYPAQDAPAAPGQLRAGERSDYGCLTILLTEDAPGGLEVKAKSGEWMPVPHVPNAFIVNIGDLMAQWSNDRYVSTAHRVANPPNGSTSRRLSIAFFHQPNHDAVIDGLPNCTGPQNPARYAPTTSGEHRLMKVGRANAVKAA